MNKHKNKIALIDGYGFVFRAFHALPPMKRPDGTPVGAIYGFTNMLIKLLANLDVSHIAVAFDSGGKTFRNEIYPEYKAHRPPCPEELKPQFPIVREVAEALNLYILEKVNFEADDLIATVAKQAAKQDFEVLIISSDKDLMQLIDDKILMYDGLKNKIIGKKEVEEKFFVKPNQVLDVLSLMGDASDNVPGVKGIGPKTAAELINQYQTLENLLENLGEIKQEKRRQILMEGTQKALISKQLITLCETVPVSADIEDYRLKAIDGRKLMNFLEKQGFRSLVARVKKDFEVADEVKNDLFVDKQNIENFENQLHLSAELENKGFNLIKKTIVSDILTFKKILSEASFNGNLIIDIEFFNQKAQSFIFSSFNQKGLIAEVFYVAVNQNQATDLFISKKSDLKGLEIGALGKELLPVLLDHSINKIGYKVKNLAKYFIAQINDFNFNDVALMGYVLNSSEDKANLDILAIDNLSEDITLPAGNFPAFLDLWQETIKAEKLGKNPDFFSDNNKKIHFFCLKNYLIGKIYLILNQRIFDEKLSNVYYGLERPLIKVLAKIEDNGILVDKAKLQQLSKYFDEEIKNLAIEINSLAGVGSNQDLNIGSPKQLAHILFDKLNLKTGKKTGKTGAFSTSSQVLEELDLEGHLIAGKILQWRHFSKLKSTYCQGLQNAINATTGRVHTTLSNISTITGRLSSNNPNLQNIPIRSVEGKKIRNAFIASKGYKFISADYSQIELRVLAAIANIDSLKQAFLQDKDIHRITASQVFGIDENLVDAEMRRKAKAINFGIIYGISAFGLAKQLRISRLEAAKYIENYFITYPGIEKYMKHYQELARQNGFVQTIYGRKCFIENIKSNNQTLKGLAERLAINAPIQGSAADIIKKAMIDFDLALLEFNLQNKIYNETGEAKASKIILQVHDELLIESPEEQAEQIANLLKTTMERAILLEIPLKVDIKISDYWYNSTLI